MSDRAWTLLIAGVVYVHTRSCDDPLAHGKLPRSLVCRYHRICKWRLVKQHKYQEALNTYGREAVDTLIQQQKVNPDRTPRLLSLLHTLPVRHS